MATDFINWAKRCEEKDQRIRELENKFSEIVERLEEEKENTPSWALDTSYKVGVLSAIEIVKEVGGMNDNS